MDYLKDCDILSREELKYDIPSNMDDDKKELLLKKPGAWNTHTFSQRPPIIQPTVESVEYDRENMKKSMIIKNTRHIYKDKSEGKMTIKEYSHSILTREKHTFKLGQAELMGLEKEDLKNCINDEVSGLNLDDFKTKESIMKFSCDNGKSNGEKRKRAIILQKALWDSGNFTRHRITTEEISKY